MTDMTEGQAFRTLTERGFAPGSAALVLQAARVSGAYTAANVRVAWCDEHDAYTVQFFPDWAQLSEGAPGSRRGVTHD